MITRYYVVKRLPQDVDDANSGGFSTFQQRCWSCRIKNIMIKAIATAL
ncbi:hypothetical protein EK69_003782 [Salmonella enterica subsp. enterica]|nr:hypothetical protein [Salmonella enterica subsp. enterica serovar Baguida]